MWAHESLPLFLFFGPTIRVRSYVQFCATLLAATVAVCFWRVIYFKINGNPENKRRTKHCGEPFLFEFSEEGPLGIEVERVELKSIAGQPQTQGWRFIYRVYEVDQDGQGWQQGIEKGDIIVGSF